MDSALSKPPSGPSLLLALILKSVYVPYSRFSFDEPIHRKPSPSGTRSKTSSQVLPH